MEIKNKIESFVREIKRVEIYSSSDFSFEDNTAGNKPNIYNILYSFRVNPEDYERKVATKRKDGNTYFEVDVNLPLLDITKDFRDEFYEKFNKKGFCVVLVSNVESMVLGNDREPLMIDFIDGLKENGSGNDQFNINITGNSILPPKIV